MQDTPQFSAPPSSHQGHLPGIPPSSTLNEILASYGISPSESPAGLRRYRHELTCGALRAVAEVWVTADGNVDAFRIWSLRPRAKRGRRAANVTAAT